MSKCLGYLKPLYANKHILSYNVRKQLCECLILSGLGYCDAVYYPCLDSYSKNRRQKVQNTCCRFVTGLRKFDYLRTAISQLGWLKVVPLVELHLLTIVHKVLVTGIPFYINEKLIRRCSIHDRDVRCPLSLTMPLHCTAFFQNSPRLFPISSRRTTRSNLKHHSLPS